MRARRCRRTLVPMSPSNPDECALFGDAEADISSSSSLCSTCRPPPLRLSCRRVGTASPSELLVPLSPRRLIRPLVRPSACSPSSTPSPSPSLVLIASVTLPSSPASPSSVSDVSPVLRVGPWRTMPPQCTWQKTPSSCARQFLHSPPFCVLAGHALDCSPLCCWLLFLVSIMNWNVGPVVASLCRCLLSPSRWCLSLTFSLRSCSCSACLQRVPPSGRLQRSR